MYDCCLTVCLYSLSLSFDISLADRQVLALVEQSPVGANRTLAPFAHLVQRQLINFSFAFLDVLVRSLSHVGELAVELLIPILASDVLLLPLLMLVLRQIALPGQASPAQTHRVQLRDVITVVIREVMEKLSSGDLLPELAPEITEVVSQLRLRKSVRPSLTRSLIVLLPLVL